MSSSFSLAREVEKSVKGRGRRHCHWQKGTALAEIAEEGAQAVNELHDRKAMSSVHGLSLMMMARPITTSRTRVVTDDGASHSQDQSHCNGQPLGIQRIQARRRWECSPPTDVI